MLSKDKYFNKIIIKLFKKYLPSMELVKRILLQNYKIIFNILIYIKFNLIPII